jgi:signal transduction histidine kinase
MREQFLPFYYHPMKITKNLEKEILAVMDDYWGSYLKGDLQTWASYLPDNYLNIGTTKEEIWSSKKEIVDYTAMVIDQMVGMAEVRNKKTQIFPIAPYFMVHELGDLFIKVEEAWTYYAPARISSVLEKTKDGWKILHQHGSYPDSKTEEGEAFAFDELKAENKKLRDVIQSRTIELEQKNRELEIEAALERVRARTMAMHKSDELLETGALLFKELSKLGVKIFNCGYVLMDDKAKIGWNYGVNPGDGSIRPLPTGIPQTGTKVLEAITESWKKQEPLLLIELDRQETIEHQTYIAENMLNFSLTKEQLLARSAERLVIYTFNFKHGYLLLVDGAKLTADQQEMVKRFAHVFEQTYRRYLDLVKAEAQAREAQIEAAMERVRAKTMAMHNSEDVGQCILKLFGELTTLGVHESTRLGIGIFNHNNENMELWTAAKDENEAVKLYSGNIDMSAHPLLQSARNSWKEKQVVNQFILEGKKEILEYYQVVNAFPDYPVNMKTDRLPDKVIHYDFVFDQGIIYAFCNSPLPDELMEIFCRFSALFEQTYRRYLDLVKAEAQTREAQIEAALERVRSITMAMHKSEELPGVANRMFVEIQSLGIPVWSTAFNIFSKDKASVTCNVSSEGQLQPSFNLPLTEEQSFREWHDAIERKETFFVQELGGKDLEQHYQYLFTLPGVKDAAKPLEDEGIALPTFQVNHVCPFNHGFLLFITHEKAPDAYPVFRRFASVFEQTYTRFLDLQKAEAQAREAQIEAALEKVRSRSLAVNKVDEFNEVVSVVFEKLSELDIPANTVTIMVNKGDTQDFDVFGSAVGETGLMTVKFGLPYFNTPMMDDLRQVRSTSEEGYYSKVYSQEEKNHYYEFAFKNTELKNLPDDLKQQVWQSKAYAISAAYAKNSLLGVNDFEGNVLGEDQADIIRRFSKVFEQAYIRFLDLQRAEAQAREAQIQLALERVRARTMAMQKSAELPEAATLLFHQVQSLGMPAWSAGYCIWTEDKSAVTLWMSSESVLQPPFSAPTTEDELFIEMRKGQEDGEAFHVVEMGGKKLVKHYQYMRTLPVVGEILDSIIEAGHPLPTFQIMHQAYFSKGFLLFITYQPVPDAHDIFKRFAKVFDQTYTRFLDLQKAEAQTREAQIEAAVERVRAQSMAMHHSDDLDKVNKEILNQLNWLQVSDLTGVTFYLTDEHGWVKAWDFSSPGNIGNPNSYTLQYDFNKYEMMGEPFRAFRQTDLNYHVADYPLEKLERAVYELEEINPAVAKVLKEALAKGILRHQWTACARISDGLLGIDLVSPPSDDTKTIALKIAGAFNQAYQRFLDLQRAEAQTREAQIEAALERVRAQTMAMHNSEDIGKCIIRMFGELTALGVDEGTRFGIGILNHDNENNQLWTASKDGEEFKMHIGNLDMTLHPLLKSARKAWKAQVPLHQYVLEGEDLLNYYQALNEAPDYPLRIAMEKLPERQFHYGFVFDHGFFYAFCPHEFQPELIHITQRFSSQFVQTYRRYLDLVRAEAQARDAEISLALERVRARTLAMQRSEELIATSLELWKQVEHLGIPAFACGFNIWDADKKFATAWMGGKERTQPSFKTDSSQDIFKRIYQAERKGESLFVEIQEGEAIKEHYAYMTSIPVFKNIADEMSKAGLSFPDFQVMHCSFFAQGYLMFITFEPVPWAYDIFKRFAKVFEQTYTRFLDLQRAEVQAREAHIEAALERIRARSMAMHKSEELAETTSLLFKQIGDLGLDVWSSGFQIWNADDISTTAWMYTVGGEIQAGLRLPHTEDPFFQNIYDARHNADGFFVMESKGRELEKTYRYMFNIPEWKKAFGDIEASGFPVPKYQITHCVFFPQGYLMLITHKSYPEYWDIFKRFGKVFEQTYTRFLDLQRAEAQTREAQINLAVERVRARALAMFKSEEILEVVFKLKEEIMGLDIPGVAAVTILLKDENGMYRNWDLTSMEQEGESMHLPLDITFDLEETHPDFYLRKVWSNGKKYTVVIQDLKSLQITTSWLRDNNKIKEADEADHFIKTTGIQQVFHPTIPLNNGRMCIDLVEAPSNEIESILLKMGSAFDLAYKRFEDLQKAEAQAREAQVEAALERTRTKSMLMQHSDDLNNVSNVFHEQLLLLGLPSEFSYVWLPNEANRTHMFWATWSESNNGTLLSHSKAITYPLDKSESYTAACYEMWESDQSVFVNRILPEEVADFFSSWQELVSEAENMKEELFPDGLYYAEAYMKYGCFGINIRRPLSEEEQQVLYRFSIEFERAYTRFLDLKKAEAQAREARIEAALEKVRSRTMAMHKAEELHDVVSVVVEKLVDLGVVLDANGVILCTYFANSRDVLHWIASPDFSFTGSYLLHYFDHPIFSAAWESKESGEEYFSKSFSVEEKNSFFEYAFEHSDYRNFPEEFKQWVFQNDKHSLSFAWSKNSAILVPSHTGVVPTAEEAEILKRFAKVFEQAYVRFMDLQTKEEQAAKIAQEKQRLEKTLRDLQLTQKQLIHAEKMASLGELTAGIAHEIQNPLNFVNNFSEVTNELIEEMKAEIDKGDLEEARALAEDIKKKLEKIHHHGERADAIVKGMLQHSRQSTAEKTATDINKLADEYLRLAYHGLRAKDKSFNVTLNTDFDPALTPIMVIPQDIGRVILNLITNAFYAVHEKKNNNHDGYRPMVTISTQNIAGFVAISVEDNGNGIPQHILDKIFQPFFTTKPTGQGTGLGLSLSYDIVKAHEGKLEVETKEGTHTIFRITLPNKK